jgi:molecular chaperone IbpA
MQYPRHYFIGFNRLFDLLETENWSNVQTYPPHDVLKISDHEYRVDLALAGWKQKELSIQVHNGELTISGTKGLNDGSLKSATLHQGISRRDFTKKFTLAEHVEVKSADFIDGVLSITLIHNIPDELKPKKISINADKQCLKG